MTVQTSTNVASFNGNGVTQIFPIAFKFNNDTDLVVLLVDDTAGTSVRLALNSDYTVSGEGDEQGGLINVVTAPKTGNRLLVSRIVDILQLLDLRNQGKFFAEAHEDAFDLLTMIAQQHQSEIGLSLRVAETDPAPGRIPPVAQRANMLMAFDSNGNPTTALPVADSSTALRQELAGEEGAGKVGFSSAISYVAGSIGRALLDIFINVTSVTPEYYGATGDGIADDSTAIENWLASGKPLTTGKGKTYRITRSIKIPTRTVLRGSGDSTQFKWDGGNGASPSSKTLVFDVSSSDPLTVALANVIIEDIHLDLNNAENVIGWNWEYASVKSRGCGLNAYNLGANSTGFRFRKEWYATFRDLSVRNSAVVAGTVGYDLSTSSSLGQINRVRMNDFQASRIDVGLRIDTSANYVYGLYVSGEFELGRIGIQHIGGLGVRQGEFNVYLESNSEADIDWGKTPGGEGTDITGSILWTACALHTNSKVNIAEGDHTFISSQTIGTLNQSGGRVNITGNYAMVKNITGGTLRHATTATALPNKMAYAGPDAFPMIGETAMAVLASATTTYTFPLPTGLVGVTLPSTGRAIRVSLTGRRSYNAVERFWDGFITQKSDGSWALTKFSYSSAEDTVWGVAIDSSTGALTITYTSSDQKVITATWAPL